MPVTCDWDDDDNRIYVLHCTELWTWEDFERAVDRAYRLLASQSHDVDFVMQFNNYMPLGDAKKRLMYAGEQPTNLRHTVILNEAGNLIKMILRKVDKAKGWQGPAFAYSMEQAREAINTQRRIHKTGVYAE